MIYQTFFESTYKYKNPDAPDFLLFDFYMLSYLNHVVSKDHHRLSNDEVDLIQDAYKTNIDILTKHMLQGVYYAIVREMRHGLPLDQNKAEYYNDSTELPEKFKKINNELTNIIVTINQDRKYKSAREYTRMVINGIKGKGLTPIEVVSFGYWMFGGLVWNQSYGGNAWFRITKGWKKLYYSKTYKDKAVYIDHLYDLQHNSGSVLDKLLQYHNSINYNWLSHALDFKRDIHNFKDIIPYISPKLRKHSLRILQKIGHIPPSPPRKQSNPLNLQLQLYRTALKKMGLSPSQRQSNVINTLGESLTDYWFIEYNSPLYNHVYMYYYNLFKSNNVSDRDLNFLHTLFYKIKLKLPIIHIRFEPSHKGDKIRYIRYSIWTQISFGFIQSYATSVISSKKRSASMTHFMDNISDQINGKDLEYSIFFAETSPISTLAKDIINSFNEILNSNNPKLVQSHSQKAMEKIKI